LIPLAIAVSRQIRKPLPYTAGAIIIGAGAAHTLVPPTPNPLAAAEILNFDLGIMVIVGLILGLVSAVISIKIYTVLLDKGMWNSQKDETGILELAERYQVPFITYTAEELKQVQCEDGFAESAFVKSVTGVGNVCERSALKAAGVQKLLIPKTARNGVTVAAAVMDLTICMED